MVSGRLSSRSGQAGGSAQASGPAAAAQRWACKHRRGLHWGVACPPVPHLGCARALGQPAAAASVARRGGGSQGAAGAAGHWHEGRLRPQVCRCHRCSVCSAPERVQALRGLNWPDRLLAEGVRVTEVCASPALAPAATCMQGRSRQHGPAFNQAQQAACGVPSTSGNHAAADGVHEQRAGHRPALQAPSLARYAFSPPALAISLAKQL